MRITLTPAYGRDYKSKAAVLADWAANKDFILNDMTSAWHGKPCNRESFAGKTLAINFRFGKLRKVFVHNDTVVDAMDELLNGEPNI